MIEMECEDLSADYERQIEDLTQRNERKREEIEYLKQTTVKTLETSVQVLGAQMRIVIILCFVSSFDKSSTMLDIHFR